ncbi:MAG: LuxR C-terminal-related transcriptional regulator [Spirochaetales bacterium]|nr:LuxR C-terminal-related transcriptional regulator [Spirochaetales bacterium]
MPTDRGFSIIELKEGLPHCIFWPDYSKDLIPEFNNRFNKTAPRVYNSCNHMLGPVDWRRFSDTEYHREFNIPLNIGYSLGIGIHDPVQNRILIFNIHKSPDNGGFSEQERLTLSLLRPAVQGIFSRRCMLLNRFYEKLIPRETSPGCRCLSRREREVLQFLMTRESIREIAENLNLSPRTVETHSLHIYQKLCVSTRRDLQHMLINDCWPESIGESDF